MGVRCIVCDCGRRDEQMNILILEDRGSTAYYLEEALAARGHRILSAFNVVDAQCCWENEQIDFIVAGSNMSPDGLDEEETEETCDGLLTGVIWLLKRVFKDRKEMRDRTIIYTEYNERIREKVSGDGLKGVYFLPKRGSTKPVEALLAYIERVARAAEGER